MSLNGHTLHTMLNIHNPYGSTNCIRFEGIISASPPLRGRHPFVTSATNVIVFYERKKFGRRFFLGGGEVRREVAWLLASFVT